MIRKLIVNADDFGLTPGVNRGILKGFSEGIVTSTSLMVNMPGYSDAVERGQAAKGLGVGLHLNLTYGLPVSKPDKVSSLTRFRGTFLKDPQIIWTEGKAEEIRREFSAQVEVFLASGLTLSHLDTHHHLHKSPKVLAEVARLATALKVPVRALDPEALRRVGIKPKAVFVNYFGQYEAVERLLEALKNLDQEVTEIGCHPGYCDRELRELSTLNTLRERELEAVTDPRVLSFVRGSQIQLTNYLEV